MQDPEPSSFSEWLDRLQRDSWNLELIISGVSIFLLLNLIDKLNGYFGNIWMASGQYNSTNLVLNFLLAVVFLGAVTLTINLLLHIVLRGFWIGGIGLRSVSRSIPIERLHYAEPFASRLKEQVPSLDQMLRRLDRICSGIFAFAFLVVLMFFSLFLSVLALIAVLFVLTQLLQVLQPLGLGVLALTLIYIVFIFWLVSSLLYFVDTISQGLLKRYRWIARWYYPVYRLYSKITLSFMYRSIYYHLITNYSRRKIQLALVAYLLGFAVLPFMSYNQYIFFPDTTRNTEVDINLYDALRPAEDYIILASIPDRMVDGRFLPLFIRYDVNNNAAIRAHCGDYTPSKKGGLVSGIRFTKKGVNLTDPKVEEADPQALLGCLSGFYAIYLDSARVELPKFFYFRHPQHKQKGITAMLNISHLTPGEHWIRIFQREKQNNRIVEKAFVEIPFWKEGE